MALEAVNGNCCRPRAGFVTTPVRGNPIVHTRRPHEAEDARSGRFYHLRPTRPRARRRARAQTDDRGGSRDELLQTHAQPDDLQQLPAIHWTVDRDLRVLVSTGAGWPTRRDTGTTRGVTLRAGTTDRNYPEIVVATCVLPANACGTEGRTRGLPPRRHPRTDSRRRGADRGRCRCAMTSRWRPESDDSGCKGWSAMQKLESLACWLEAYARLQQPADGHPGQQQTCR
jgi:hypothetical protein